MIARTWQDTRQHKDMMLKKKGNETVLSVI